MYYANFLQVGKAKHEILLSSVKSVEPPSKIPKGGTLHVFEVKFSGKGSPWVISARSQVRDKIAMLLGVASPLSRAVACSWRFGGYIYLLVCIPELCLENRYCHSLACCASCCS